MLAGAHMDFVGGDGAHRVDARDLNADEALLFELATTHLASAEAIITVEHFR